jgi:hypothetical protein
MSHNKFKAKTHHWYGGVLEIEEFLFDVLEDAFRFLEGHSYHQAKIYNHHGHMLHEFNKHEHDSYA